MKFKNFTVTVIPILGAAALISLPMKAHPHPSGNFILPLGNSKSVAEEVWQSDQMDIEYPVQIQPLSAPDISDKSRSLDAPALPPMTAGWTSDQMDIEYPIQEQPDTGPDGSPGISAQTPVNWYEVASAWQSDQMDIEYPIQEQPGTGTNLKYWTAGDHLEAASRYEEEVRRLRAEVQEIELAIGSLLPYHEVDSIRRTGIIRLLAQKEREVEIKTAFAEFHRQSGMNLKRETDPTPNLYGPEWTGQKISPTAQTLPQT